MKSLSVSLETTEIRGMGGFGGGVRFVDYWVQWRGTGAACLQEVYPWVDLGGGGARDFGPEPRA